MKSHSGVLHVGDIAGVPQNLSLALNKLGINSKVLSFSKHPYGYGLDIYCPIKFNHFKQLQKIIILFVKTFRKYKVLHFHFTSISASGWDLILWKLMGKKIVMHYHGSDIRKEKQKLFHKLFSDSFLVSTPDLLEYVPKGIWIPNPIDTEEYDYISPNPKMHKLKILHAPSNRRIKGTEFVISTINELKQDGYDFDFLLLENVPHEEVIKQIRQSDIIIDQLLLGWYGMFSIEAMSIGRPVLCYILDSLVEISSKLPIINTTPELLHKNLRELIEKEDTLISLGFNGRKYIEEMHASNKIAKQLIYIYDNL